MTGKRFTSFIEDDGYWIRDEYNFKIIATGLKFGVSENLTAKLNKLNAENIELEKEIKELQERNNRQAKQLGNIYHLIEKQDWKTLKGIIEEFKECEEQLQKEWSTYGDV